jgi:transposase
VITELHGMTGRDIMNHLIAGQRDPKALAQLVRDKVRPKIARLEQALEGAEFFTPEHAGLLKVMLARIDAADAEIARLTAVIERLLAPMGSSCSRRSRWPGGDGGLPRTSSPKPVWT